MAYISKPSRADERRIDKNRVKIGQRYLEESTRGERRERRREPETGDGEGEEDRQERDTNASIYFSRTHHGSISRKFTRWALRQTSKCYLVIVRV